jgi:hypothetical protein
MARINVLERSDTGEFGRGGKKKPRNFRRVSTAEKYYRIQEIGQEKDESQKTKTRNPVQAQSLHIGSQFSQDENSKNNGQGDGLKNTPEEKKTIYRTGPTSETAVRKPSHEISVKERIAAFEDEIGSEFSDGERRYVRKWIDIYPAEFRKAIEKREKNGGKVAEKDLPAIRLSFINDIARWGMGRGMAPEKANILEKYLELKLPVGIPSEKEENIQENDEEKEEKLFTLEQSSELFALVREIAKIRNQVEPSELQEIIEEIIREKFISQGIFSEDDFSRVQEHVTKWIKKFNDKI